MIDSSGAPLITSAALPMHIDGHLAHQGDTMHEPILAVVVVDCPVLSCPVSQMATSPGSQFHRSSCSPVTRSRMS